MGSHDAARPRRARTTCRCPRSSNAPRAIGYGQGFRQVVSVQLRLAAAYFGML